jgi:sortase (surface protein transpeptidase)
MSRGPGRHAIPPSGRVAIAVLLCGLLALAVGASGLATASRKPGHPGLAARPPGTLLPVPRGKRAPVPKASTDDQAAVPARLIIPAIDVRTKIIYLGLTKSGALQVPPTTTVAGWYTGSPRPGDIGSSIIIGHIDSLQGPGVFYRLSLLRPGDRVYVREKYGRVAVFQVNAVHMYLKARFPAATVYGPTPNAQLRLITCGGAFDPATGHYLSNVVAFATFVR